jgi:hypothetical protein
MRIRGGGWLREMWNLACETQAPVRFFLDPRPSGCRFVGVRRKTLKRLGSLADAPLRDRDCGLRFGAGIGGRNAPS